MFSNWIIKSKTKLPHDLIEYAYVPIDVIHTSWQTSVNNLEQHQGACPMVYSDPIRAPRPMSRGYSGTLRQYPLINHTAQYINNDHFIAAIVARDGELARAIPPEDDLVDTLYDEVNRQLIQTVSENPASIDRANYLMWAAHNLERMADRVTNICERTLFVLTGNLQELDISDDESPLHLR